MSGNKNKELREQLKVGTKIKYGKKYAKFTGGSVAAGQVVTLVEGYFEHDNGLYTETQTAPSVWDEKSKDFDSIYHLFGNDLEDFLDCEIVS